jgi:hypothetical protein
MKKEGTIHDFIEYSCFLLVLINKQKRMKSSILPHDAFLCDGSIKNDFVVYSDALGS